jgi:uncharacterized protein
MTLLKLSTVEAKAFLLGHHRLIRPGYVPGARGLRALLRDLRCIQIDPLDVMGANADLVALARIDGIQKGDLYRWNYPGYAFEHFAKERCLLPASHFPWYRQRMTETPWWRLSERVKRVAGIDF